MTAVLISSTVYNELLNAMKGVLSLCAVVRVLIHMSHYFFVVRNARLGDVKLVLQIYRDLLHHADEYKVNLMHNSKNRQCCSRLQPDIFSFLQSAKSEFSCSVVFLSVFAF